MAYFLQALANALPQAALYACLAYGYAIAFGMTRRADFSQGALFAFSGQVFALAAVWGWTVLWLTLPAAIALAALIAAAMTGLAAALIARSVTRPLVSRAPNAVTAASLGVMLALMETARLAGNTRSYWIAPVLERPVVLFAPSDKAMLRDAVMLPESRLAGAFLLLAAVIGGQAVLSRSRYGRAWRAVRDDAGAAVLCGIDSGRVIAGSYVAAAAFAGLAGLVSTLWFGTMDTGATLVFGLKVIFIAALGAPHAPLTAAAGGIVLALAEALWGAYMPGLWRDAAIFAGLALVLVLTRGEDRTKT